MKIRQWFKKQVHKLYHQIKKLYIAIKLDNTPFYAKLWGTLLLIYALSPIDLIPDFIPIIGYLDDLIIIPFGIWIFKLMITKKRWMSYDELIEKQNMEPEKHWYYALPIVMFWIVMVALIVNLVLF